LRNLVFIIDEFVRTLWQCSELNHCTASNRVSFM
jgi:hypothetical protein